MCRLFNFLKEYKRILVTGPQRSGTTICGKMIADSLGYKYIDEVKFDTYNENKFDKLRDGENIVIQCPHFTKECCHIDDKDTAVIFMKRSLTEIYSSQERINWAGEKREKEKFEGDEPSAKLKYEYIAKHMPSLNKYYQTYKDLKRHPLWKEKRKDFHPKQT